MPPRRPRTPLAAALAAALALSLSPAAARADVVSPPPMFCPDGSEPATCHGGPHCEPLGCGVDSDCKPGLLCKASPLCIAVINCGGLAPPDAAPNTTQAVTGFCTGGEACEAGAACSSIKVCVTPPSATTGAGTSTGGDVSVSSGCSCGTAGGSRGVVAGELLALGAAALWRWRRRDQRASRQRRA